MVCLRPSQSEQIRDISGLKYLADNNQPFCARCHLDYGKKAPFAAALPFALVSFGTTWHGLCNLPTAVNCYGSSLGL
jgi:hypothetical protein